MFKKKDPKDMVREWQSKMRTEMRGVDRQIRGALASRTESATRHIPPKRLEAVNGRRSPNARGRGALEALARHEHDATTETPDRRT